jgi:hypothetical protein
MTWPSATRFRYYFTSSLLSFLQFITNGFITYTVPVRVLVEKTRISSSRSKTIAMIHRRLVLTNLTSKIIGSPLCTSTCRRCPNSGGCGYNPLGLD